MSDTDPRSSEQHRISTQTEVMILEMEANSMKLQYLENQCRRLKVKCMYAERFCSRNRRCLEVSRNHARVLLRKIQAMSRPSLPGHVNASIQTVSAEPEVTVSERLILLVHRRKRRLQSLKAKLSRLEHRLMSNAKAACVYSA